MSMFLNRQVKPGLLPALFGATFGVGLLFPAHPAVAQEAGAAVITVLDPSIRASGMGRASCAVTWGSDLNAWGNPALLGGIDGVQFRRGRTRLVPDLADDVWFKSDQFAVGAWGMGVQLVGRPFDGFGRARLEYGQSMATNEEGEELGPFDSHEEMWSWSVGASLPAVAENLWRALGGAPPPFSRHLDLAYGFTRKRVYLDIAPAWVAPDGVAVQGSVTDWDHGFLIRVSPVNSIGGPSLFPALDRLFAPVGGARLDLAYAESVLDDGHKWIAYPAYDQADPMLENSYTGYAVHAAIGVPQLPDVRGRDLLARSLGPLVSLGWAEDEVEATWPRPHRRASTITHRGWELSVAGLLALRRGRVIDRDGDIDGHTSGVGVSLPLGPWGRVQYDHAIVPQARVLDRVRRNGYSIEVRPLEIYRDLR